MPKPDPIITGRVSGSAHLTLKRFPKVKSLLVKNITLMCHNMHVNGITLGGFYSDSHTSPVLFRGKARSEKLKPESLTK